MNGKLSFEWEGEAYRVDLSLPLDISIPLRVGENNPRAWYCGGVGMEPVRMDGFVGSVKEGGSVNFRQLMFNPHGHGTHTETYGHISEDVFPISRSLKEFHFMARVYSIAPEVNGEDLVIGLDSFLRIHGDGEPWPEAVIIRSLPNVSDKLTRVYTETNPPYFDEALMGYLAIRGVKHFITDLPSVDRERDEGKLLGHRAFWDFPLNPRADACITEMAYLRDEISDGWYWLNLQVPCFENDAAPSRPVLYRIEKV